MKEQTKVDWTKAAEGATHYCPNGLLNKWYKQDEDGCWLRWSDGCWKTSHNDEYFIKQYIQRTTQSPEWKIKHIKADDYKCGRDVALTILYKDIGDGYYEYKYAICNPKDMFSRKKGVEVALSKPDTWKVYVGNYNKVIEPIIYHIALSTYVSEDFVNLVVGQGFFNP